jgi:uroporphyrinogen-III synthase
MARILVTRPEGSESELVTALQQLGHEVMHCPLIAVEPLGDGPIDLTGYDWLVVTSPNGAREIRRRGRGPVPPVAAIGRATADALGGADLVPSVSTQEGLLTELPRPAGRVLFAGAEGARRLIVDELDADFVPLYRTIELSPDLPDADLVVLASASAARAYAALGRQLPAVSIGPETTRAARAASVDVVAEAATHDVVGLVAAVVAAVGRPRRGA